MTRPEDLAAHCIRDVFRKAPLLEPEELEDVILGCAQPYGPQGANVARKALLLAGLPVSVPGVTVNRFCSSGLDAVAMAAHTIVHEGAEAAVAGGVESFSMTPRDVDPHPRLQRAKLLQEAADRLDRDAAVGGRARFTADVDRQQIERNVRPAGNADGAGIELN